MPKLIISIAFLFCCNIIFSQTNGSQSSGPTNSGLAFFLNPISPLEAQQAAIGAGIAYTIKRRYEVAAEFNYLFEGFCQGCDNYKINHGYRVIITAKRFLKHGRFFYGVDSRLKKFSYGDRQNFINSSISDTLLVYQHTVDNTLLGGAIISGVKVPVSHNKKLAFEFNIGIGLKYRFFDRRGIPAGFMYRGDYDTAKDADFFSNQEQAGFTFYLPAGARLFYFF